MNAIANDISSEYSTVPFRQTRVDRIEKSIHELIEKNLNNAQRMASQFFRGRERLGIPKEEFQAAANLGLVEAARKFNPEAGNSFLTFSFFRIRGAMSDLLRRNGPVAFSQFREFQRKKRSYPETPLLGALPIDVSEVLCISSRGPSPFELVEHKERLARLREAVQTLPACEQALLHSRYVLEQSCDSFCFNGERFPKTKACRLHRKILQKLRRRLLAAEYHGA